VLALTMEIELSPMLFGALLAVRMPRTIPTTG
jgi:hypothetical protein